MGKWNIFFEPQVQKGNFADRPKLGDGWASKAWECAQQLAIPAQPCPAGHGNFGIKPNFARFGLKEKFRPKLTPVAENLPGTFVHMCTFQKVTLGRQKKSFPLEA